MAKEGAAGEGAQTLSWWSPPGETDVFAYVSLIFLLVLVFLVIHLYARFDRYTEEINEGTPLKTTIPTLLTVALAYEIFPPLHHFSFLLPVALIGTALARDLMLWFEPKEQHALRGELEHMLEDKLERERTAEHARESGTQQAGTPKQMSKTQKKTAGKVAEKTVSTSVSNTTPAERGRSEPASPNGPDPDRARKETKGD